MEEKLNQSLAIRETVLDIANKSDEGHIPSSFSIVEIMLAIKKHQERKEHVHHSSSMYQSKFCAKACRK